MRALITGVAGFVGSRLASRLLDDGSEVVGLDSFTEYYDPSLKRHNVQPLLGRKDFRLVESDLLDPGWEGHLDGIDVVFHQAGQPGVRASWEHGFEAYTARNVLATQRLLEVLRARHEAGDGVQRLVYASSSSVYGDAMTFPTHEDLLPAPFSPYGVTKLAAEHLCGVYARNWGLPSVSLRYFTVYGGGQRPDMALYRMIEAALHGTSFPRFGDGSQRRDFTHVDDVVAANLAAVHADVRPGEVINIAGGSNATVADLLDLVGESVGRSIEIDQRPPQPGDVARTGGETAKAKELLGWSPMVSLVEGIKEQVAWHQQRAGTG
jgi:UDP-glucuronate 4-epimerase